MTSLPPCDHPELLAIPHDQFHPVDADRYPGVTAHDTVVDALGVTRRAVITHSPTFHRRQAAGFDQTLAKAHRQLPELQARLARGRTRKSAAGIQAEIDRILFTNHHDWPVVDVVATYRTQPDVEDSFRQLKDPHVVSLTRMGNTPGRPEMRL